MANSADVLVRFLADTSQVNKGVDSMGSTMKGFARSAGTLLGGVAIGAFARDAVDAANSWQESVNKMKVVFGSAAGEISRFTRNAAEDLGMSRQQAVDAAATYGNMFTQLGIAPKVTADMSKGLLTLTADLVSFHNADPTAVIEAQNAAFRGEYDSLQKYIPTINAAAVEQRALADRAAGVTGELTAQEKAAATYKLMIEGAGKATGDWAATSDSAANSQRTLQAKTQDATVSIGTALQPALAVIVPLLADFAQGFADLASPLQNATVALAAFGAVALAIGGPVGLIVAAVGAVAVALVLLWTQWDEIWGWIRDHPALAALLFILSGPIGIMVAIVGALKTLWTNWDQIWGWIKQAATDARDWIVGAFNDVVGFFRGIPGAISGALSGLFDILTAPFREAWSVIQGIAHEIGSAFDGAIGAIKGVWNAFARGWNSIQLRVPGVDIPLVGEVGGFTIGLPDLPMLASGGIVKSPTLLMAGERGAEAIVPLPSRLGGNNYSIRIDVAPGVSPAEVGAATVDAIRAYERVAGTDWRRSA